MTRDRGWKHHRRCAPYMPVVQQLNEFWTRSMRQEQMSPTYQWLARKVRVRTVPERPYADGIKGEYRKTMRRMRQSRNPGCRNQNQTLLTG